MPDVERTVVKSSNVKAVAWREAERTLEVEFVGGGTYWYHSVPREVVDALLTAPSVGSFLNERVKPKYTYHRVAQLTPPSPTAVSTAVTRWSTQGQQLRTRRVVAGKVVGDVQTKTATEVVSYRLDAERVRREYEGELVKVDVTPAGEPGRGQVEVFTVDGRFLTLATEV